MMNSLKDACVVHYDTTDLNIVLSCTVMHYMRESRNKVHFPELRTGNVVTA